MKSLNDYIQAIRDKGPFGSAEAQCEFCFVEAQKLKDSTLEYILSFHDDERQKECDLAIKAIFEKVRLYNSLGMVPEAGGLVFCVLWLCEDLKERGLCTFIEGKEGLEELKDLAYFFADPFVRDNYLNTPEGEETAKKRKGRTPVDVESLICSAGKESTFQALKQSFCGMKGKELAYLVEAALILGLLKERPPFEALKKQCNAEGTQAGFNQAFSKIHNAKVGSQIDENLMAWAKEQIKTNL